MIQRLFTGGLRDSGSRNGSSHNHNSSSHHSRGGRTGESSAHAMCDISRHTNASCASRRSIYDVDGQPERDVELDLPSHAAAANAEEPRPTSSALLLPTAPQNHDPHAAPAGPDTSTHYTHHKQHPGGGSAHGNIPGGGGAAAPAAAAAAAAAAPAGAAGPPGSEGGTNWDDARNPLSLYYHAPAPVTAAAHGSRRRSRSSSRRTGTAKDAAHHQHMCDSSSSSSSSDDEGEDAQGGGGGSGSHTAADGHVVVFDIQPLPYQQPPPPPTVITTVTHTTTPPQALLPAATSSTSIHLHQHLVHPATPLPSSGAAAAPHLLLPPLPPAPTAHTHHHARHQHRLLRLRLPPPTVRQRLAAYSRKWMGVRDTLLPLDTPVDIAWSWFGAFVSIAAIALLNQYVSPHVNVPVLVASFGASAVLVFGVPASKLAQPRNFLGGQVLSAVIGVLVRLIFHGTPHLVWLSAALGMSSALAAMQVTRTTHPPGGATALIASSTSIGSPLPSFKFILTIIFGSLIMLFVALVVNNLSSRRRYPTYWWGTPPPPVVTS